MEIEIATNKNRADSFQHPSKKKVQTFAVRVKVEDTIFGRYNGKKIELTKPSRLHQEEDCSSFMPIQYF